MDIYTEQTYLFHKHNASSVSKHLAKHCTHSVSKHLANGFYCPVHCSGSSHSEWASRHGSFKLRFLRHFKGSTFLSARQTTDPSPFSVCQTTDPRPLSICQKIMDPNLFSCDLAKSVTTDLQRKQTLSFTVSWQHCWCVGQQAPAQNQCVSGNTLQPVAGVSDNRSQPFVSMSEDRPQPIVRVSDDRSQSIFFYVRSQTPALSQRVRQTPPTPFSVHQTTPSFTRALLL